MASVPSPYTGGTEGITTRGREGEEEEEEEGALNSTPLSCWLEDREEKLEVEGGARGAGGGGGGLRAVEGRRKEKKDSRSCWDKVKMSLCDKYPNPRARRYGARIIGRKVSMVER